MIKMLSDKTGKLRDFFKGTGLKATAVAEKTLRISQHATQGGCWFCNMSGTDVYDSEFDTFLHLQCLRDALEKEPEHPEATIMQYLLE